MLSGLLTAAGLGGALVATGLGKDRAGTNQRDRRSLGDAFSHGDLRSGLLQQFLGAFNDNVFKRLMLLLVIPVGAAKRA